MDQKNNQVRAIHRWQQPILPVPQLSLEERLRATYETLDDLCGIWHDNFSRFEMAMADYDEDPVPFNRAFAAMRIPDLVQKENLVSMILRRIPQGGVNLVDVGCFDGSDFTSVIAHQLGDRGKVYGLDRFYANDFNGDMKTSGFYFRTDEDVLQYVRNRYGLSNLLFEPLEMRRNTSLSRFRDGDDARKLAVTSFRIPDNVSCYVINNAVQAKASVIAVVPVNTGMMPVDDPDFTPQSAYFSRSRFPVDKDKLQTLLQLKYAMASNKRSPQPFEPRTIQDRFNYQVNMAAKQLVMLDRAQHLQEHGYKAAVYRYDDGFGWGTSGHHHLLVARK